MKLVLTFDVEDSLMGDKEGRSKIIRRVAASIEQGASDGFIRNDQTGSESSRWNLEIVKHK